MSDIHPHNTPEAKKAFEQAQAEWYEQRYRDEVECYSVVGFWYGMKWILLIVGLFYFIVWLWVR